jgi:hypothetical protein
MCCAFALFPLASNVLRAVSVASENINLELTMDYEQYKSDVTKDIKDVIASKACQPILFVGSGFSKRYCNAPNWEDLLVQLGNECPEVKHEYAYYRQSKKTMPQIGSIFAAAYKEWAWNEGKALFPGEYFSPEYSEEIFFKYAVAQKLKDIGPDSTGSFGSPELDAEIAALKKISPHAVISTNYDQLLEPMFDEYQPIVGQQVIRHSYMSIGEIFKIHGCISDPPSLTITEADYSKFANDKKYLSAKLFTYFVEHPLIFVGYAAGDENIKNILQEIDHMLPADSGLIDNIYLLEWKSSIDPKTYPARERIIDIGDGRTIRIKGVCATSFQWVFDAFRSEAPLEKVNVKLLRSISHRVVHLVRKDAAKNTVEINFEMLSHALEHPEDFAKVFGIAAMTDPALFNLTYKYLSTSAAEELGFKGWNPFNQLIAKLRDATGFDMRASDNLFHVRTPSGTSGSIRKYSQAGVDLIRTFKDGGTLPDLTDPKVIGEKPKSA